MRHRHHLAALAALVFAAAGCTGESALPEATGKGTVRAIHAAKGAPAVDFLIEERPLDSITYKSESVPRQWDDFEFNFNFEALLAGDSQRTRVATEAIKVDVNRDYTFVFTGPVASPAVFVWEADTRTFGDSETVFESRLAHVAPDLGSLDFYFDLPGVQPVAGMARGTLAFGEILPPIDAEAGEYVLTVTAAGDPSDIVYRSNPLTYAERSAYIIPLFEGDATDTAPYTAQRFITTGGTLRMPDSRFPPTARLIQASSDLATADVYTDEALTELLVAGHAYRGITGDLPIAAGNVELRYTPAGNTGAILFETSIASVAAGSRLDVVVLDTGSDRRALVFGPDRRSISTVARITALNAASNHERLDLFVVDAGTGIDDAARTAVLGFGVVPLTVQLAAGSYDLYLTVTEEKTIVAGPLSLDLALGDTVATIAFDVTDPSAAEFAVITPP